MANRKYYKIIRKLTGINAQLTFLCASPVIPMGSYYVDRILDLRKEKAQLEFDLATRMMKP